MSLVVLITIPQEKSRDVARVLVAERLAACVNITPKMYSVYRWQGDVFEGSEDLLLVKTTDERYVQLEERIQELHPYEVPEIIAVPIDRILPTYQDWLHESVESIADQV